MLPRDYRFLRGAAFRWKPTSRRHVVSTETATKRDISDSAVRGLVLRIGFSGAKTGCSASSERSEQSDFPWSLPSVSLAQARAAALENRDLLERGIDPRKAQRSYRRQSEAHHAQCRQVSSRSQKIGINTVRPHDLRRTGRTELARLGVSRHIAERVLNHSKDVIEGTYDVYE
jgi:hypothetical protein